MAIVAMKKLTLVGLESERKNLLTTLSRIKCVELINMDEPEFTIKSSDVATKDDYITKMHQINSSLMFIKECSKLKQRQFKDKKEKKKYAVKIGGRKIDVKYEDFLQTNEESYNLFTQIVDKTEVYAKLLQRLDADKSILVSGLADVKRFVSLDVKFSQLVSTQYTSVLYGVLEKGSIADVNKLVVEMPNTQFIVVDSIGSATSVVAVCLKENVNEVYSALAQYSFVECHYDYDMTAKDKIKDYNLQIEEIDKQYNEVLRQALSFKEYIPQLEVLYDYYNYSYQLLSSDDSVCKTASTYILQAWLPHNEEERVTKAIQVSSTAVEFYYSDPIEEEQPPIITKNNKFVTPHEEITDLFSVPNYYEKDPNWAVAIFFFLFFGIIIGDAGYGLVLALGALVIIKFIKPEKGGFRNLILVFGIGGISAMMWGILFGSYFTIDTDAPLFQPILVSPLKDPMTVIAICVGLGVIQIMFGIALHAADLIRKKQIWDAIFDCFVWEVFFLSLIALAVGGLLSIKIVSDIGLYTMLGSLAVVALTNGRHKKGIGGKLVGAVTGIYGVINYLSDVLSYLRLFGLCLAGGVIGMVFNEIAKLLFVSPFLYPFGIAVALVGHSLNLALGILGAYVHDSRLQHIEFFGKFYVGDGVRFKPFANETKYISTNN